MAEQHTWTAGCGDYNSGAGREVSGLVGMGRQADERVEGGS